MGVVTGDLWAEGPVTANGPFFNASLRHTSAPPVLERVRQLRPMRQRADASMPTAAISNMTVLEGLPALFPEATLEFPNGATGFARSYLGTLAVQSIQESHRSFVELETKLALSEAEGQQHEAKMAAQQRQLQELQRQLARVHVARNRI
jgi:hypothetical protein